MKIQTTLNLFQDCENVGAVQPSDIYGSAHLLRLMVKVGTYLSFANYSEASLKVCKEEKENNKNNEYFYLQVIEEHIDEFLSYLDMNRSMFFTSKNYIFD